MRLHPASKIEVEVMSMPRQGKNIYQRKDGRWEGRYSKGKIDGKTRYGYVFGKTYEEAEEKLEAAKESFRKGLLRSENKLFMAVNPMGVHASES